MNIINDDVDHSEARLQGEYVQTDPSDSFWVNSEKETFPFTLEPTHLQNFLQQRVAGEEDILSLSPNILNTAEKFAQIVDAKSPYTAEHSVGVAQLARYLGEKSNLSTNTCNKIEIAGLFHDLGKLQIPTSILDKTESLNQDDISYMRHHSYASFTILKDIEGMEEIAQWASNHHEALDGSGYPFHKTASELSIESRIIIISDIFQAMAQDRPYRKAHSLSCIICHLKEGVTNGRLDGDIVVLVEDNQAECYQIATEL